VCKMEVRKGEREGREGVEVDEGKARWERDLTCIIMGGSRWTRMPRQHPSQ
jgi:hypothetical protein